MTGRPIVPVITTGGTIASRYVEAAGGCVPDMPTEKLLDAVTDDDLGADVEWVAHSNVLGTALGPEDLFAIGRTANTLLARSDVVGVVVTAGTGIIEEGSYLCELLNSHKKPIVWTGSQVDAGARDSDGPRNLHAAIRVAASPGASVIDAGALVCFNDEVFAARDVVKVHKTNRAAFSGLEHGIVGRVDENGVVWFRQILHRRSFAVEGLVTAVDLIKLAAGSDSRFFRTSISSGARAIVVEGFPGTGMVSPGAVQGIAEALAARIWVVLSARSPLGSMLPKYGSELGAASLVRQGVVLGGSLSPAKIRLLLMVLLASKQEPNWIRGQLQELCF